MVSLEDSHSSPSPFYTPSSSPSPKTHHRSMGRSMRTIRSNLYPTRSDQHPSETLSDSAVDFRLDQLAHPNHHSPNNNNADDYFLDLSQTFSDCSSDISGELQRLATIPKPENESDLYPQQSDPEPEPCNGFLERDTFSTEIIESISPEDLQPTVKICIDGLRSASASIRRSAAAKLRLLAKNRSDNRVLIADSGAVPALIPLLRCPDPFAQEHAVTALLNLSLHEPNRKLITNAGAIKSLIYVLKTGTETSKQNAACALLSLSLLEENKVTIGTCGAIPPLVALLIHGSCRGKKDALTTLYKLCSVRVNKERAVRAGAVGPLVAMVVAGEEEGNRGVGEKAMVVLSSLAGVEEGKAAIVAEGGIAALVEAVEDGSAKGKEFAVMTLLMLCGESVRNRGLLVREGGIPPLVALSQNGTAKAKHKAETLLRFLREPRQEASTSSP